MSAPSSVYSRDVYTLGSTADPAEVGCMLPLNLSAYGGADNAKALFYLDEIFSQKDSQDKDVFFGCVRTGTKNYRMHAAKRLGKFRFKSTVYEYIVCNDGGLNTLPKASFSISLAYENYYRFSFNVKSAYYALTTSWGVYMYNNTNGQEYYMQLSTAIVNANGTFTGSVTYDKKVSGFNAGDNVSFKPYAINEEGRYIGDGDSVMLKAAIRVVELDKYLNSGDIQFVPGTDNTEKYIGILLEDDYTKQFGINQMLEMDTTGLPKPYPYQSLVDVEGAKGSTFDVSMLNKKLPFGYYYGFEDQKKTKKYVFQIGQTSSDASGFIRGWLEPRERTGKIVVTSVRSIIGTGRVRISVQLTGNEVQYPASVRGALQTPLKMNGQPTGMWIAVSTHDLTVSSNGLASIEVSKGSLSVGDKIRFMVTQVAGVAFPSSDLDRFTYNESTYEG